MVLSKEATWLDENLKKGPKEQKWPGVVDQGGKMRVRSLERECKSSISPLRPVGPGTERAKFQKRLWEYSGSNSEGNRFVSNDDL